MREPRVLNVAEKPSVARALAAVFAQMNPGVQDQGMRRDTHQVFTCEHVQFPAIRTQGNGQMRNNGGQGVYCKQ